MTETEDGMNDENETVVGACYRDPEDGNIQRVVSLDPFVSAEPDDAYDTAHWSGAEDFRKFYSERVPDPTPAVVEDLTVRELGERLVALDTFIRGATWTPGGPWNVLGERYDEAGERHFVNGTGSTLEAAALDMLAQMAAHVASEDGGK